MATRAHEPDRRRTPAGFVEKVLIVAAVAGLAVAIYKLAVVFLLGAAAIVVAAGIHLISDPLHRRLGMNAKLAVVASVLTLLAALGAIGFLFGVQIVNQLNNLLDALPRAWESLRESAGEQGALGQGLRSVLNADSADPAAIIGNATRVVGGAFNILVGLVAVIVSGIILAIYPAQYREGALMLAPQPRRERLRVAANECGRTLKGWFTGQLVAMSIIGVLTSIGLMLVGVPSWLVLGLFAGLAQFVPLVGPIVSAIPGLIVAGSEGVSTFFWALAVYVGVQQLESNLITPFVMRKATSLPMALTLFAIVGFSALFGVLGAILATPIAVVAFVLTRELYVKPLSERGDPP